MNRWGVLFLRLVGIAIALVSIAAVGGSAWASDDWLVRSVGLVTVLVLLAVSYLL